MINDEFFDQLPENPVKHIEAIANLILEETRPRDAFRTESPIDFDLALDAYVALIQCIKGNELNCPKLRLEIENDRDKTTEAIRSYAKECLDWATLILQQNLLDEATERYKARFSSGFKYEFSDGDLKRIQELINRLRELLQDSTDFLSNHKERLLKRLDALQSELRKTKSNLDKFWGFVGDAGVALGKFGENAKPFVECIREMISIAWNTQAKAEGLPPGTHMPLINCNEDGDEA